MARKCRRKHPNSKTAEAVRVATTKGYVVLEDGTVRSPRGQILKSLRYRDDRYYHVMIYVAGEKRKVDVHLLAAFQKFGEEALQTNRDVRHLDNNPLNCCPRNLALGTHRMNLHDSPPEVREYYARAAAHARWAERSD